MVDIAKNAYLREHEGQVKKSWIRSTDSGRNFQEGRQQGVASDAGFA